MNSSVSRRPSAIVSSGSIRAGARAGIPLILAAGLLAIVCVSFDEGVGWLALVLAGVATFAAAKRFPAVRTPLLVAFLLRAVLALTNRYVAILPDAGGDAVIFERYGWNLAQAGIADPLSYLAGGAGAYYMFIAVVYSFTGHALLVIQAINVLAGTMAVLETYRISHKLWGWRPAVLSAWILALQPTINMYSAIILREAIVVYCALLGMRLLLEYLERRNILLAAGAVLAFAAGGILHNGIIAMIPLTGWFIITRLFSPSGRLKPRELLMTVGGLALVVGLGVMLFQRGWGLHKFHAILAAQDLMAIGALQERMSKDAGAAYLSGLVMNSWSDILWQSPIRLVYFLFAPFPWMVRSLEHIIGVFDSSVYLALAFNAFRRRRTIRASSAGRCVFWSFLVLALVYAIGTSNFGTAIRHRVKVLPLLIILALAPALTQTSIAARDGRTRRSEEPDRPAAAGGG